MRNPKTLQIAQKLRHQPTEAERRLWRLLRQQQLQGHKFRRQVPVGRYVADFACIEARLIVELDGGQHMERTQLDARRTAILEAHGYRVLRFWNNEVFENAEGVLAVIMSALLGSSPHPVLPPRPAREGTQ